MGEAWIHSGHFLVTLEPQPVQAVMISCSYRFRQRTMMWAPLGRSTTSSAMTLTGEHPPQPPTVARCHSPGPGHFLYPEEELCPCG